MPGGVPGGEFVFFAQGGYDVARCCFVLAAVGGKAGGVDFYHGVGAVFVKLDGDCFGLGCGVGAAPAEYAQFAEFVIDLDGHAAAFFGVIQQMADGVGMCCGIPDFAAAHCLGAVLRPGSSSMLTTMMSRQLAR